VVSVRNRFVPAARTVRMGLAVLAARVTGRARRGVRRVDGDGALVDVIGVDVMQVAIVNVVRMVAVRDCDVSAAGAMTVLVSIMGMMRCHAVASVRF
jgi:hypothetical protein